MKEPATFEGPCRTLGFFFDRVLAWDPQQTTSMENMQPPTFEMLIYRHIEQWDKPHVAVENLPATGTCCKETEPNVFDRGYRVLTMSIDKQTSKEEH